ncbi:hypothetical protein B0T17DRAFT_483097 [Bombardia bombarda]|uniref:Cyclin-dependent protein kinase regulator pho80 n=1 Tax=Bombardia bombarda TaxID=252184 RepID=A0AA39XKR4_9PEZI|nr:hypothetical protein B0T17DRAFT_483097 [Bombardia bombarda]
MRLPLILSALLAATATAAAAESLQTAVPIFIQPITSPETAPTLLAEVRYDAASPTSSSSPEPPTAAEVSSYEAPEIPDAAKLLRIGVYDRAAARWASSTSVISVDNFGKGYSPHFVVSVDDKEGNVVGVACRGVRIDAGQTRDFGPQAAVVVTGRGKQPELNKPVVLSPQGRKVEVEEKTLLQKYWWVLGLVVLFLVTGGGDSK